jgi:hypothetical protein
MKLKNTHAQCLAGHRQTDRQTNTHKVQGRCFISLLPQSQKKKKKKNRSKW